MAQSLVMAGEILRAAHVMACSAPRSIHKNRRGSRWRASRPVAIETVRLGGIAHNFWGLIGSVVAAVLPTTREIFEPTVRLYGAVRRNCQGVNAVSWQNFVPRAGVRYGDDSGVAQDDVIHIGRIDFRNDNPLFGIKHDDRFSHVYVIGKTGTGKS